MLTLLTLIITVAGVSYFLSVLNNPSIIRSLISHKPQKITSINKKHLRSKMFSQYYDKLINRYNYIYGKNTLDHDIKSLMKYGLTREEAIMYLAEKEKLAS